MSAISSTFTNQLVVGTLPYQNRTRPTSSYGLQFSIHAKSPEKLPQVVATALEAALDKDELDLSRMSPVGLLSTSKEKPISILELLQGHNADASDSESASDDSRSSAFSVSLESARGSLEVLDLSSASQEKLGKNAKAPKKTSLLGETAIGSLLTLPSKKRSHSF